MKNQISLVKSDFTFEIEPAFRRQACRKRHTLG